VALVKPGRGACWNQARNSFKAMLYTRFVIGEETLSSTSVFSSPTLRAFQLQLNQSFVSLLLGIIVSHVMWTLPLSGTHINRKDRRRKSSLSRQGDKPAIQFPLPRFTGPDQCFARSIEV
jgi:hypothetical protein